MDISWQFTLLSTIDWNVIISLNWRTYLLLASEDFHSFIHIIFTISSNVWSSNSVAACNIWRLVTSKTVAKTTCGWNTLLSLISFFSTININVKGKYRTELQRDVCNLYFNTACTKANKTFAWYTSFKKSSEPANNLIQPWLWGTIFQNKMYDN